MQNAKVFVVDDNTVVRRQIGEWLKHAGHQVVLEAATLEEFFMIYVSGQIEAIGIDIAIVDGMFPDKDGDEASFNGKRVYSKFQQRFPDVKVIAYTNIEKKYATYGDFYVGGKEGLERLVEVVNTI